MIAHTQPRDIVERLERHELNTTLRKEAAHEIRMLRQENLRLRALFNDFDAEVRARLRVLQVGYD